MTAVSSIATRPRVTASSEHARRVFVSRSLLSALLVFSQLYSLIPSSRDGEHVSCAFILSRLVLSSHLHHPNRLALPFCFFRLMSLLLFWRWHSRTLHCRTFSRFISRVVPRSSPGFQKSRSVYSSFQEELPGVEYRSCRTSHLNDYCAFGVSLCEILLAISIARTSIAVIYTRTFAFVKVG